MQLQNLETGVLKNRPLDRLLLIVWMDGIVFKVRKGSKLINKTIYLAENLNCDGKKKFLECDLEKKVLVLDTGRI